jgi:hypothetical protein
VAVAAAAPDEVGALAVALEAGPEAGAEAELARLRVEVLRLMRQLTMALEQQGTARLPGPARRDLLALHAEVGALLDRAA